MGKCIVCGIKDFKSSYHKFPKTPERKKRWIEQLKLQNEEFSQFSTVCSNHFRQSDFTRLRLKKGVIPKKLTYDENGMVPLNSVTYPKSRTHDIVTLKKVLADVTNSNTKPKNSIVEEPKR